MSMLALFAGFLTLAFIFAVPIVKGFQRPTFQRHPSFTFSPASPVKLLAIQPATWGNTAPLQSILIPPGLPEVSTNLDIFCNPVDSGVVEDIGIWIEA